jgi:hypothetical protein
MITVQLECMNQEFQDEEKDVESTTGVCELEKGRNLE